MTRRAAKYKRISRDREGLALGIERQDHDLDALAERRGLVWASGDDGDYFDNDLSASTKSRKPRPDYQRLLTNAKAGKFEVIAAYTTSRITRRPREFEDLIDLATQHGIEFQYVRSPEFDLSTAQGREIARMLAARDAREAEETGERVTAQKRQAATGGRWKGGRRPYGYEADGVTIRPAEAVEVLRASQAVLTGTSLRSLAADMNRRGLKTSTGKAWRQDTMRKVLLRPRNAGLMEHQGEIVGEAKWPAIVPEHTWRGVVATLKDPGRRTQFSSVRRWMGSGLYRCHCGAVVRATTGGVRTNQPKTAYMCSGRKCVARTAEDVDAFVTAVVLKRLARPDAVELLQAPGVDTAALHVEAAALRAQLDELAGMYARRVVTARQLETGTAALRRQLDAIDARLAEATRGSVFAGLVGAADVAAAWDRLDLDRRRAVVAELMTVVLLPARKGRPAGWKPGESYFDPETVRIKWQTDS